MKEETWTATYVLTDGSRKPVTVTAHPLVIDDLRYNRLKGVAETKSWKKVG